MECVRQVVMSVVKSNSDTFPVYIILNLESITSFFQTVLEKMSKRHANTPHSFPVSRLHRDTRKECEASNTTE